MELMAETTRFLQQDGMVDSLRMTVSICVCCVLSFTAKRCLYVCAFVYSQTLRWLMLTKNFCRPRPPPMRGSFRQGTPEDISSTFSHLPVQQRSRQAAAPRRPVFCFRQGAIDTGLIPQDLHSKEFNEQRHCTGRGIRQQTRVRQPSVD